jgi:hypothetical protein
VEKCGRIYFNGNKMRMKVFGNFHIQTKLEQISVLHWEGNAGML